jgi:hypothetical protein
MPGHGPPPKPPEQRRRRNAPERGDWIDLPPVTEPILPELPKRPRGTGRWHPRTVAAWTAWRQDPATTQYGPAEIAAAVELAWVMDDMVRSGQATLVTAVQRRMDTLGLTAKGKRDLRWRPPTEQPAAAAAPPPAPKAAGKGRGHLRAV